MASFPLTRILTTWFVRLYFRILVKGESAIPAEGPFVVVANHASFLDPFFIGYASHRRQVGFMAKEELFKIPLFGGLIRRYDAFPVRRGQHDTDAVQRFHDFLHLNKPLLIFPEGTRTLTGELQKAKKGVGLLLYNAQVPVIPAYVGGTFESWPKGKLFPKPRKTSVRFGKPLALDDLYREKPEKDTYRRIAERVMESIADLKGMASSASEDPPSH
jgi:1-acyl-sn-glycerol-3-phosphate acyltransferase